MLEDALSFGLPLRLVVSGALHDALAASLAEDRSRVADVHEVERVVQHEQCDGARAGAVERVGLEDLVHELGVELSEGLLQTFDRIAGEGLVVQDERKQRLFEEVAALVASVAVVDAEETAVLVARIEDAFEPRSAEHTSAVR